MHQALFCDTDWDEDGIYGQRFRQIAERSGIDEDALNVKNEVIDEYRKRIADLLSGKKPKDKGLIWYKILSALIQAPLNHEELSDALPENSAECMERNLELLEKAGFIQVEEGKFVVSRKFRDKI
ncbi:MAG: hypothetical protein PHQ23_04575 [Candidatus Wallbacteria bacterium]|nr:hypothetical protein [Candidatus Wallbacteria bacterium]